MVVSWAESPSSLQEPGTAVLANKNITPQVMFVIQVHTQDPSFQLWPPAEA